MIFPKGGRDVGSSRYRAYQVGDALSNEGWDVRYASPSILEPPTFLQRGWTFLKDLGQVATQRPEIVLAQRPDRRGEQRALLKLARWQGAKLIFDVDDPVDTRNPTTSFLLANAAAVFVASHKLGEMYAEDYFDIHLVPTSVDTSIYRGGVQAEREHCVEPVVLGWVGTGPTYRDALRRTASALQQLPTEVKNRVLFRCVGTLEDREIERFLDEAKTGVETELVPEMDWSDEGALATLIESFDLGLAPHRGAGSAGPTFKIIQYMAAGVVPIGERQGEIPYHIEHGESGFLTQPNDPSDLSRWIEHAVNLDPKERQRMKQAAYEHVESRYSLDVITSHIDSIMRAMLRGER